MLLFYTAQRKSLYGILYIAHLLFFIGFSPSVMIVESKAPPRADRILCLPFCQSVLVM